LGFPALAEKTGIHVKTLHQMFGPKGNPTAAHLFKVIACLQKEEGVRLRVVV
jgi:DNA-binding phage protein